MERELERYYTSFKRPPFAFTYHPSEEEFADPINYVAKIRPEAEKYGLIKIVPPASFRPPFCIDSANFEFVPRVQRLNEIDALFRLRIIFINKLVHFWKYSKGQQFRIPYIDNRYIDLYRLQQVVEEEGGLKRINETRRWSHIASILGFRQNAGQSLKQCYAKWIHPFAQSIANKQEASTSNAGRNKSTPEKSPAKKMAAAADEEEKSSPLTRSQARMMAGGGKGKAKAKPVPSLDKSSIQGHKTPIELVVCVQCGSGDDEARLLLCETCDASLHTYCAQPPLNNVPKGEWRCPKCVASAVKSVSMDFGFTDSQQRFSLDSFGEWANLFKQQYFDQAPCDVPIDMVESEFWRNVIDIDKSVQVKYGADLISSKVGSGFPRKEDAARGVDAKERQFYANHPWNLNNLPKLRESVLCHMTTDISGMMVPWVYVGMLFSTFCWHVEDHWTYSINYNHWGERKIWYGIPGSDAENFDKVVKESVPELFTEQSDLLHHMITHVNPQYLIERGIPVYTVHQSAGEFVITFPRAYHAGFNEGLNFAEAVNFAPPDWLKMGRRCLENYAVVRRNCVFSHEELVMKMVSVAHKMSIGMSLATLEELRWIVGRETEFRRHLAAVGVHDSAFCRFEDIPDDSRSCIVCRTTLFCSGLVCQHEGRIVCMQHVDQLCTDCVLSKCCMKYRYTLEDLVPLVRRLSERTNSFFEWRKFVGEMCTQVDELKFGGKRTDKATTKIDVVKMRQLAEQWRTSRYPHCEEVQRINSVLADFEQMAQSIRKVLNRKIRLRDHTRCQKADTRWEYAEVLRLRQQLAESIFEERELEAGIENLCRKVEDWKRRTSEHIGEQFNGIRTVDALCGLIYEAEEEFNVRLEDEGLAKLRAELVRCQWLVKANKALEQMNGRFGGTPEKRMATHSTAGIMVGKSEEGSEEEEGDRDAGRKRVDLQRLVKLIADSKKSTELCPLVERTVEQLEQFHRHGFVADGDAAQFLASRAQGAGYETADAFWRSRISDTDWVQSEAMDTFRKELELARKILSDFGTIERDSFSLRSLEQLEHLCTNSLFERDGRRHERIRELTGNARKFVDRIRTIFQRSFSYYNVFDIVAGRSDLPALIEGDSVPLKLFTSTKYSDNWRQLRSFDSREQLVSHIRAIADQQPTLLHALRLINAERPLRETCSCARDSPPAKNTASSSGRQHKMTAGTSNAAENEAESEKKEGILGTISCFICNANFHRTCAKWDPFLGRLPQGIFLCQRCLRSRRPCVEDVEAACYNSGVPENCFERILVQNLIQRATDTFAQLHRLLLAIPRGTLNSEENQSASLKEYLAMALSLEVVDTDVYRALLSSAYFDLFPLSETNTLILQNIRHQMVDAEPQPVIFSLPIAPPSTSSQSPTGSGNRRTSGTSKRRSSGHYTKSKQRKQPSSVDTKTEMDEDGEIGVETEEKEEEELKRQTEKCAADFCLRPYSEFTRWIQCEAGCARWYHFCCVGISVRGAQLISAYCCYKCAPNNVISHT